ncbi:adenosylcobinamide-phosphate synthase CbiB [Chondrinema litorale]|uniref:adenosylcobinamide-phosphate synthase CbiB n=1 Tax=Chondrinema litorale TaxID=2994555 RepID=UPI002543F0AF|nr:adenosylcobinamide-phosphate synthase CbiB [Chondrinema litorale]UZR99774.1 adenosylcobinamide-phosphate synthase CbiB [Chondrinema litorale]
MESEQLMEVIAPLVIGYLLDLLLADPENWPHPIRLFGNMAYKTEQLFNNGKARFLKGSIGASTLIISVYLCFYFADHWLLSFNIWLKIAFDSLFVYWGIANKSLIKEVSHVFEKLYEGLEKGRKQLARIVGRDTSKLNDEQIKIAALESLSENLSDGTIAPLFFYALLGVPGIMAYKMANTLDSMWGYRNERFEQFGKFAARFDDLLNYIPARLTAFFMGLLAFNLKAFKFTLRYGKLHKSPNAGYPEAALAGILDCRFGGPNIYHGELVEKPFIGENQKNPAKKDLEKAMRLNHLVTAGFVLGIAMLYCLYYL